MSVKHVGAMLLAVALGLYVFWDRKPESVVAMSQPALPISGNTQPDQTPLIHSLEQRLADLEERLLALELHEPGAVEQMTGAVDFDERLAALEVQLRRQPGYQQYTGSGQGPGPADVLSGEEAEQLRIESLEQAFDGDDNAEPASQVALENVENIFDSEELDLLEFRQIDCREHYCRLAYESYSAGTAANSIAESELILKLAEKYGNGITVHGGEHNGGSKSVYIEMGTNE